MPTRVGSSGGGQLGLDGETLPERSGGAEAARCTRNLVAPPFHRKATRVRNPPSSAHHRDALAARTDSASRM
jgi:hypothetical protein